MKNSNIIIAVIVVVILGVGILIYTSNKTPPAPASTYTGTIPPELIEPTSPTSTPIKTETAKIFTLASISTHKDRTSCYSAINGIVYDLTSWIDKHPGGPQKILNICGKDGSSAFSNKHAGEPKPEQMLATFKVGMLAK